MYTCKGAVNLYIKNNDSKSLSIMNNFLGNPKFNQETFPADYTIAYGKIVAFMAIYKTYNDIVSGNINPSLIQDYIQENRDGHIGFIKNYCAYSSPFVIIESTEDEYFDVINNHSEKLKGLRPLHAETHFDALDNLNILIQMLILKTLSSPGQITQLVKLAFA